VRFYQPTGKNSLYLLISSAALSLIFVGVLNWMLKFFVQDEAYLKMLSQTMVIRFFFMWLLMVLIGAAGWLWFYMKEQNQDKQQFAQAEKLLREAELSNLRQQLQPHFLFNSLNSISSLVGTQPEQARKMVEQLSDFLRGTIRKDANQLVSFEEEIRHLNLYLEIEKVRFGHRLETVLDISDESKSMRLPSLLLQPVVENAIKFGLYDTIGTVVIKIIARMEGSNLLIEVTNPFDPESSPPKSGTGFGLNSIQRRLSLLYFRNDLLKAGQQDSVFVTTLKIPQAS
jgi:LytS/YehU family sensor histidine kinase